MELNTLLNGIQNFKVKGDTSIDIKNIDSNSKNITANSLFIAIKGYDFDGHKFVEEAIANGATAVILDMGADLKGIKIPANVTTIITDDTRKALAICSSNFYGNPSKKLKLIGITGTKGKTTTTYMVKSILEAAGHKVGLIGTIENYAGEDSLGKATRTTPESLELQRLFYQMAKENVEYVVMEVSSQSLKLNRVYGLQFEIGIFTNFYKDHISLKEHADMDDYFNSKLKLFSMCKKGFVNFDDFKGMKVKSLSKNCDIKTYAINNEANLLAKEISPIKGRMYINDKLNGKTQGRTINRPGRFSVYNALAAISVANELKIETEKIKEGLENISVPGRSELVPNNQELAIMIDYAHTPESLENILQAVKTYTKGRVICVFGCGGDRDTTKRPLMGEVAGRVADFSIVTTDNPRTEEPGKIIEEIEEGIAKTKGRYKVIIDRREAIGEAIKMMNKNDIVVLAGKGHEPYQEINGEKIPFDERIIVKEFLEEKK